MSLEADGVKAQVVARGSTDREKDLIDRVVVCISNCNQSLVVYELRG